MASTAAPSASTAPSPPRVSGVPSSRESPVLPCAGVPLPAKFDTLPTLTRTDIASRIARGELVILHPPLVYRVPHSWLAAHPGGKHSLLHYVGRDASCEIEAYHSGRTVKDRMGRWVVGKVEVDETDAGEGWRDMVPPIQQGMWPIPVPDITITSPPPSPIKERHAAPSPPSDSDEKTALAASVPPAEPARILTPEMVDPPLSKVDYARLPLTPAYQAHLRRSHRALMARIHALGLDTPPGPLSGYGHLLPLYLGLAALSVWLYRRADSTAGYALAAVALGAFWHQVTFVVHDAGHTGLTGDWWTDRMASCSIAGLVGGLSGNWWCDNHNVHHLVTNAPEHDPDIQHLPFFAISNKFFNSLRSTYYNRILAFDAFAQRVLPYQHNLYYLIMCFARFNLAVLSYTFLSTNWPSRRSPLFKTRCYEIACIMIFYGWFGWGVVGSIEAVRDRVVYLLVSFAVTSPLHVQIVLSHFSQPVSILPASLPASSLPLPLPALELLESHPHRQLRTTMDIASPAYLDFLHGGLNFQTPHHLFPRLPRFRFRAVARLVEEWVVEENKLVEVRKDEDGNESRWWAGHKLGDHEGLVYKKMAFVEGNRSVLGVLRDVGGQVRLLAKVAEADAKGQLHHH
ncbi:hypothetical protein JCM10207_001361 [Rhodosporidiobolus poonsookiae]